mgnify:CR=1 FL=1
MEPKAALTEQDFPRFSANVTRLLARVARDIREDPVRAAGRASGRLPFYEGWRARLHVEYRRRGMRPLVAILGEPWFGRAYLGRVNGRGDLLIFGGGIKILFDRLLVQGGLTAFNDGLEAMLDFDLNRRARAQ